jgi:hypothetical protein
MPLTWDSPIASWDAATLTWDGMAPNPNPNMPIPNISAQFTTAALAALKTAIEALDAQFPALVTLTEDERKTLPRVGAAREAFCETALSGAATFPTVLPGFMSKAEWDKDDTYFTQLGELDVVLAARLQKLRDTRAAVGAERYRQARKWYEAVKAAREYVPGLEDHYQELSEQFEGQGSGGEEEPPPGGGTPP